MTDRFTILPIAAAIIAVSALVVGSKAKAHDWYPQICCSGRDCKRVPASRVKETPAGYVVQISNETLSYGDSRVKQSPDDQTHLCTVGGKDDGRTICLFMPPRIN